MHLLMRFRITSYNVCYTKLLRIINFKELNDVSEVIEILKENDIEYELLDDRLFLNPEILDDLIDQLKENDFDFKFSAYISEYYPTSDKLEVERNNFV